MANVVKNTRVYGHMLIRSGMKTVAMATFPDYPQTDRNGFRSKHIKLGAEPYIPKYETVFLYIIEAYATVCIGNDLLPNRVYSW